MNAKYDALEKDYRHIASRVLALTKEKEKLSATVYSPADPCGLPSPESVFGSRRESVAVAAAEGRAQPADAQLPNNLDT